MLGALGGTFGYAMGLALSPIAITTILVLLTGERRGHLRGFVFAIGWFIGVFVITLVPMLLTDVAHDDDPSGTETGLDILHLVFAAVFFILAVVTWIKRPAHDRVRSTEPALVGAEAVHPRRDALVHEAADLEPADKKGFLSRIDDLGVWACLGLGIAQAIIILKDIPLGISAGTTLGATDLTDAGQVVSVIVFSVLASLALLLPLLVSVLGGAKVDDALREWRRWIEANMTAITLVVLLVVGVIFLGQGLGVAG
ncbi:MAG: GAP family protein [Gordonia sp. (in: high G+C Gram-positive bacteria)]|uniref:GAP family protein n=1 Tax=Gordonia sp. (in: high G+C Gram-positive bacteria) TaxID=84139 RepID=UPI003C71F6B6